ARATAPGLEGGFPFAAHPTVPVQGLAGVLEDRVLDGEGLVGQAEDLLGGGDLLGTDGGTVNRTGVLLVRGRPADDGAQPDEGRALGLGLATQDRRVQGLDVFDVLAGGGPVDLFDVPAVGTVTTDHVLTVRDAGVVLDRDLVVVPDHDEVAQVLRPGQRTGLVADTLLDVTVGAEGIDVVVEGAGSRAGLGVAQTARRTGGHGHAHGVAHALAQG